eukprot:1245799-Pyramimonas_sp.AAC.1
MRRSNALRLASTWGEGRPGAARGGGQEGVGPCCLPFPPPPAAAELPLLTYFNPVLLAPWGSWVLAPVSYSLIRSLRIAIPARTPPPPPPPPPLYLLVRIILCPPSSSPFPPARFPPMPHAQCLIL